MRSHTTPTLPQRTSERRVAMVVELVVTAVTAEEALEGNAQCSDKVCASQFRLYQDNSIHTLHWS